MPSPSLRFFVLVRVCVFTQSFLFQRGFLNPTQPRPHPTHAPPRPPQHPHTATRVCVCVCAGPLPHAPARSANPPPTHHSPPLLKPPINQPWTSCNTPRPTTALAKRPAAAMPPAAGQFPTPRAPNPPALSRSSSPWWPLRTLPSCPLPQVRRGGGAGGGGGGSPPSLAYACPPTHHTTQAPSLVKCVQGPCALILPPLPPFPSLHQPTH